MDQGPDWSEGRTGEVKGAKAGVGAVRTLNNGVAVADPLQGSGFVSGVFGSGTLDELLNFQVPGSRWEIRFLT